MTDAPDLTPEQDAVRRLLADARHDGPTPPAVVARLDDVLASLADERQETPVAASTHGPVVDLGARRRRRAGMALLAAAAVVVAGVAIGQGLPRMSSSDSAASADGGDTATSGSNDFGAQDDSGSSEAGSGAAEQAPGSLKSTVPAPEAGYPTLSSSGVGLDDDLLALRTTEASTATELDAARTLRGCDLRGTGRGRRVGAEVDGFPGVVLFRRPDGAAQQVDLYVCGSPVPVRQLTLPAP